MQASAFRLAIAPDSHSSTRSPGSKPKPAATPGPPSRPSDYVAAQQAAVGMVPDAASRSSSSGSSTNRAACSW